jgi:ribosomal protein S18 acetylase RimI-like enzyme
MIVREATSADIPTLVDFQLRMAVETENITLDIAVLTLGIQHLLKDPTKGRYYVAEQNHEIIGCLMTTPEWSDWRDGTVVWIQSVYVSEKNRHQGVYKELYAHIRKMINENPDLKGVRLYVDKRNKAAQGVYSSLGMNGDHYEIYEWMKS